MAAFSNTWKLYHPYHGEMIYIFLIYCSEELGNVFKLPNRVVVDDLSSRVLGCIFGLLPVANIFLTTCHKMQFISLHHPFVFPLSSHLSFPPPSDLVCVSKLLHSCPFQDS